MDFRKAQLNLRNANTILHARSTDKKFISESSRACCLRLNSIEEFPSQSDSAGSAPLPAWGFAVDLLTDLTERKSDRP